MADIAVTPQGSGQSGHYLVEVRDGDVTTTHDVHVPSGMAEQLGCPGAGDLDLVEASFRYLLEREPNTSILRSFSLDQIGRYFSEWSSEMAGRLRP
jgi:hypothetical protein